MPIKGLFVDGSHVNLDGVSFYFNDCPSCLDGRGDDCENCDFFIPEDCRIRRNEDIFNTLLSLKDNYQTKHVEYLLRTTEIVESIQKELSDHGRPLHFGVLTRMVAARYPKLIIGEWTIIRIVSKHPDLFENLGDGVIQIKNV